MQQDSNASVDRLTVMLSVPDVGRADVAMTADKTYYRFATDDSIEDGELPGLHERFSDAVLHALEAFSPGVNVAADIAPMRFTLFINNRSVAPAVLNPETLRTFTRRLANLYAEMAFVASLAQS